MRDDRAGEGLKKLGSSGKTSIAQSTADLIGEVIFVPMLTQRTLLARIRVMEVWGRYKFTIGDLTFDAQDTSAAACEIASRGIACLATAKHVLPVHERVRFPSMEGSGGAVELRSWQDAHRSFIAAKIVYRRAYPERPQGRRDTDARRSRQMGMRSPPSKRSRPGLLFRPWHNQSRMP